MRLMESIAAATATVAVLELDGPVEGASRGNFHLVHREVAVVKDEKVIESCGHVAGV